MKRNSFASAWAMCAVLAAALAAGTVLGEELKSGAFYPLDAVPAELIARAPAGAPVRLALGENGTTGYGWEVDSNSNECEVVVEHHGPADARLAGAPGRMAVTVTSKVETPARIEFRYRRPWEKDVAPLKTVRLLLYTAAEKVASPLYPDDAVMRILKRECAARGITLVDWHLHIRGGMTPELAAARERASGIRSTAMENHGREWEIFDNARLCAFADRAKAVRVGDHALPVGIQVNDREWFHQIDAATRARFDYILADTMIMGKLPDGRDNRLWMVKEVDDADAWMARYMAHNLRILDEPIDILANPTYLPTPLAAEYDRLWTEERMRAVIAKAVARGIALEIQAGSPYPRPKFLMLAKEMGAKFSFGTNNFDPRPKDLSRWLEAIVWLDLHGDDVWTPSVRRK